MFCGCGMLWRWRHSGLRVLMLTGEKKLRGRIFIFLKQKKIQKQKDWGRQERVLWSPSKLLVFFFLKIVFLVVLPILLFSFLFLKTRDSILNSYSWKKSIKNHSNWSRFSFLDYLNLKLRWWVVELFDSSAGNCWVSSKLSTPS